MSNKKTSKSHNTVTRPRSVAPVEQLTSTTVSGPMPSADEMAKYAKINSNLVDRIVSLAEKESDHRHKLEFLALETDAKLPNKHLAERKLGQIFGFSIGVIGLLCSVAIAWMDHEITAAIIGGTTVTGLVGTFIAGQVMSKK